MKSEELFLAEYTDQDYERPSVAVDVALLSVIDDHPVALLIQRPEHPYSGAWQLPGAFIRMDESLDQAAGRALEEKTGVTNLYIEQLYTFGEVDRDPRTRVISVAYFALVDASRLKPSKETACIARLDVPWKGEAGGEVSPVIESQRLEMAFDHAKILGMAIKRLRGKLRYAPIGYELLGETFTLHDLQRIHQAILGKRINKDSFRRRMLASGELEATGALKKGDKHRPAALYRHKKQNDAGKP